TGAAAVAAALHRAYSLGWVGATVGSGLLRLVRKVTTHRCRRGRGRTAPGVFAGLGWCDGWVGLVEVGPE
ncbi:hypothetical protein GR254_25170, partial [Mycobacterium tuberculosis]|nr:hypothetical protein [Mycobacterium tuberculosis]